MGSKQRQRLYTARTTVVSATLAGLVLVAAGLLALIFSFDRASASAAGSEAPQAKPNIVLILTDDEAALDGRLINFMPTAKSVFKDKGITFTDFHSSQPLCCPARATLLTGQYSHNHGVIDNYDTGAGAFNPRMTLATQLKAVGYHTALVGKYMIEYYICGSQNENCAPNVPPGWDDFAALGPIEYYNYTLWDNGVPINYGSDPSDYNTDVLNRESVDAINDAPVDKPIFLYIAPKGPHKPNIPAPRHVEASCPTGRWRPPNWNEEDVSDKPAYVRALPRLKRPQSFVKTCRTLLSVDDLLRDVRAALQAKGRLANTIFIWAGDNGMNSGEHRIATGLGKASPYQTEIPFYMAWPAGFGSDPRTIVERLQNIDFAPTICEIAGCTLGPYPNGQATPDGRSFRALLIGGAYQVRDAVLDEQPVAVGRFPAWASVETTSASPLASQGCQFKDQGGCRWHYTEYNTGEKELYDASNGPCHKWQVGQPGDPCELENQINNPNYANIIAALHTRLEELKKQKGS